MSTIDLAGHFIDLYATLQRQDRDLEWQSTQAQPASYAESRNLTANAEKLDRLGVALAKEVPAAGAIAAALDRDAACVAEDAGKIYSMATSGDTYGSGWGTELDNALGNVRSAIGATVSDALALRLIDLYADLNRNDRDLEWFGAQSQPASEREADRFAATARTLNELAGEVRRALPEEAPLADALDTKARNMARDIGMIRGMASSGEKYANEWSPQWDATIGEVHRAIDVVLRRAK